MTFKTQGNRLSKQVIIHTDGGSRGNPGIAVVRDSSLADDPAGSITTARKGCLSGPQATNNVGRVHRDQSWRWKRPPLQLQRRIRFKLYSATANCTGSPAQRAVQGQKPQFEIVLYADCMESVDIGLVKPGRSPMSIAEQNTSGPMQLANEAMDKHDGRCGVWS